MYIWLKKQLENQKTSKNETVMIVSRVATESIRNTNETERNENEICKNDETTPKYVRYDENILQEMKTT